MTSPDHPTEAIHLLVALWPLFALIVLGYGCRRLRFPNEGFWPGAERINYFVLFPALLFRSLATAPLDAPSLPRVALGVGLVLAAGWIALVVLRALFRWPAARFGVFVQAILRFNTYVGLAVIGAVFGRDGLAFVAVLLAITVPVVNVLSIHAFAAATSVRTSHLALAILRNPLILACLLGFVVNVTGLRLAGGTDGLLSLLAATSLPLGLLCVGAALQPQELRKETAALFASSAGRLMLVPLVAYGVVRALGLPPMETAILVLFFSLPTAPTAYVLARQLGGDAHLMAGIITLQTLLAAATLPVVIWAVM